MKKLKILLLLFTLFLSTFVLSACSISNISPEKAFEKHVAGVNFEDMLKKNYIEISVEGKSKELSEGSQLEVTKNYAYTILIQPTEMYVKLENKTSETVVEYWIKKEDRVMYEKTKSETSTKLETYDIDNEMYASYKEEIINTFYNETILPKSVEDITETDVAVKGISAVKIYFTNEHEDSCSVTISDKLFLVKDFSLNTKDKKQYVHIIYEYPLPISYTDIPSIG